MNIYLVGGAVRDELLGLPIKEKDYVVVGATPDEMLKLGYRQVGKDFPVFLHPKTQEEYALARIERKIGLGYTGFSFDASTHVTLEEDLKRRDLTINAMAKTKDGILIDPYHGKNDLEKKILRHVSPAFSEDPVRILRVARFLARFSALGFSIAPETTILMKKMVQSGEVAALVAERVWREFERALEESHPEKFFEALSACDALPILFPALSLTNPGMMALSSAAKKTEDTKIRFAVLLHALSNAEINALSARYRIPSDYRELALLVSSYLRRYQSAMSDDAAALLHLLESVDAFRREARFQQFLMACDLSSPKSTLRRWMHCFNAAKSVTAALFVKQGWTGKDISEKMHQARRAAIEKIIQS